MNRLKLIVMPGLALALALSAGAATAEPLGYRAITLGKSVDAPQTAHRGHRWRDHDRDRHHRYRDRRHDRDRFHRYRPLRRDHGHRRGAHRDHRFAGGWWPHHRTHGFKHRYYRGNHYYYNDFGFFFPGFGLIHHGHRHGRHCPDWHYRAFATGALLGGILAR